jgi:hypothetical protein
MWLSSVVLLRCLLGSFKKLLMEEIIHNSKVLFLLDFFSFMKSDFTLKKGHISIGFSFI